MGIVILVPKAEGLVRRLIATESRKPGKYGGIKDRLAVRILLGRSDCGVNMYAVYFVMPPGSVRRLMISKVRGIGYLRRICMYSVGREVRYVGQ